MPCLIAAMLLGIPRITIILMVIFSDYIGRAYATTLWPLLGFIFMPYTTIAYAVAKNIHGSVDGLWLALVVVAVLFDLGVIGHGSQSATKRAPLRAG